MENTIIVGCLITTLHLNQRMNGLSLEADALLVQLAVLMWQMYGCLIAWLR